MKKTLQMARKKQLISFKSEGYVLDAALHLPDQYDSQSDLIPAVLMCHGFLGTKMGTSRLFLEMAHRLALEGIASLRFDFRGCGESEGNSLDISVGTHKKDALNALEFLKQVPGINTERIGILGGSFGGTVASILAMEDKKARCLALWAPMCSGKHLNPIVKNAQWMQDDATKMRYTAYKGRKLSRAFLEEICLLDIAPLWAQEMLNLPLFIAHSVQDDVVTYSHAQCIQAARKEALGAFEMLCLEKSGHDFGDIEEQELMLQATCAWFIQHLSIL